MTRYKVRCRAASTSTSGRFMDTRHTAWFTAYLKAYDAAEAWRTAARRRRVMPMPVDYRDTATGLRITDEPHANGARARAVYKGDERIWHGEPVGVGYFLKGYAAAKAEPIEALMEDPRLSDVEILCAARSILEERGADTENLQGAIWSLKAAANDSETRECGACEGYGDIRTDDGSVECKSCAGTGYEVVS